MKKIIIASILALGLSLPTAAEARDNDHRGHGKSYKHGNSYGHNNGHGNNGRDWHRHDHDRRIIVKQPVAYYAPAYRPYHPQVAYYSYYSAYPRPVYYTTPRSYFSFNF